MKVTKHEIVVLAGMAALATVGVGGPADAATAVCASTNPPNTMTLVGGTPQTARLQQPFDSMLAVTLGNTNGFVRGRLPKQAYQSPSRRPRVARAAPSRRAARTS